MEQSGLIDHVHALSLEYHYDEALTNNTLSSILHTLEKHNFRYIINPNILIGYTVTPQLFAARDNRYVLMIDAYRL